MFNKYILLILLAILLVLLIIWIIYGNTAVEIKTINVSSKKVPKAFEGFKIAHISDLHNAEIGKGNEKLLLSLEEADADIIVITGDVIDSRRTNIDVALRFANDAVKLAPTYYVNGNHESRLDDATYNRLVAGFESAGVTVLENESAEVNLSGETITLIGMRDPNFSGEITDDTEQNIAEQLVKIIPENDNYKVLLIHRPEYFDVYADKVDLVFSGHAHGGQVIVPFVGGVIAPGQGFWPEYYDGLYEKGKTSMIVSRGIGNSLFPFRVNNRPTLVVAQLHAEN